MKKRALFMIVSILALIVLVSCKKSIVEVSFDYGNDKIESHKIIKGDKVLEPDDPTRDGYEFIEWQLDGVKYEFENIVDKSFILVAKWEKTVFYEVTFDTKGGSTIDQQAVKKGGLLAKPINPTKDGFDFVRWKLDDKAYNFSNPVSSDLILVAEWQEALYVAIDNERITIFETEKYQLNYSTNDELGISYSSYNDDIATINEDGIIEGVSIGEVKIIMISKTNSKILKTLYITVEELIYDKEEIVLAVGMTHKVDKTTYEKATVANKYILNINEDGIITAELKGKTTVTLYVNDLKTKVITISVVEPVRTIEIVGPNEFYLDEEVTIGATFIPINGFNLFKYIVEDERVMTIDENGLVYPKGVGKSKVRVVSLQNDQIFDEIEITVKGTIIVSKELNTFLIGNWEFIKGVDIFDSVSDAILASSEYYKIILHNIIINEDIFINKNVTIIGNNSQINNTVLIDAKEVVLKGITFRENAQINSTISAQKIVIENNKAEDILGNFISLGNYLDLTILNNDFKNIEKTAISLFNINVSSKTLIKKNNINNANKGIELLALGRMKINNFIKIYRNKINNVSEALSVDMSSNNLITNAEIYARFNEITNYDVAIRNIDDNKFEYTFNYFGFDELDLEKFINVEEKQLLGFYKNNEDILSEELYKPSVPIIVLVEDMIEEIELGEEFKINPTLLPYTAERESIILNLNNYKLANLTSDWRIIPLKTGLLNVSIYALGFSENKMSYDISITTEPGIHFEIDNPTYKIKVGDEINIKALPYPYNISDAVVNFSSSNTSIATVDSDGKVTIVGTGKFSIYAQIDDPVFVREELIFASQLDFDENNVMDFITMNQLMYNKSYDIALYGDSVEISTLHEGVSKVVLNNVPKKENIIPVIPGFRPGVGYSSNIPDEYKFNPKNLVWIVVHDTGNNNAGAGAELHSNYLYNQATQNGRKASWHYTVDAKEMYLHVPENEWAYHAGDGSSLPGLDKVSPALGGGNSNGLGIEMSVQRDGNVFKTWQNTAKLVADLLYRYNLPLSHQRYHNDFSGKECPQTMRRNGFLDYFEELVEIEYVMRTKFASQIESIEFISHNEDVLNNTGMIIAKPNKTTSVSYTIKVTMKNSQIFEKTFNTIVEGQWR